MCSHSNSPLPCCSYMWSAAGTSERTGRAGGGSSGSAMVYVQRSSAPPHQATRQEHLRDRASPMCCHLFSASPGEPGLSCTLPPQRHVWTYRPLPFCVAAPSPPVLSPSAAPSLFCPTNKTSSASPSDKRYLSSPPPTQLTGQVHPAACSGKPRAYQRHKSPSDVLLWNLEVRGRQHEGCSFQASIPTSPVLIPARTHTTALNRSGTGVAGKLSDIQRDSL